MIKQVLLNIDNFRRKVLILLVFSLLSACQIIPDTFKQPLESIQTNSFVLGSDSVIGQIAFVYSREGETLPDIARHFGLGFNEISRANKNLKVWLLEASSRVMLPLQFILPDAPRKGIVMNLANMRLFYYPNKSDSMQSNVVMSFPIGIGKDGWSTPLGKTRIISKTKGPNWYVPASIRREHALKGDPLPAIVRAGPDNPLGEYAMRLGFPGYLIHGTNKPYGVGLRVSHGCVRLYPESIEELFHRISVGIQVKIVDQPYLVGWRGDMLYLEAHPEIVKQSKNRKRLKKKLLDTLKQNPVAVEMKIDWQQVDRILAESAGIPLPILATGYTDIFSRQIIPRVKRPDRLYGAPIVPPLLPDDWSVLATTFVDKDHAIKLSAILNHQGPQIPSRIIRSGQNYQVVAGPFASKKQADKAARRIRREFEIDAQVQKK